MADWFGFARGESVGDVLARNRGIGPGFDAMRFALAVAIFVVHIKWIAGGHPPVPAPAAGLLDGGSTRAVGDAAYSAQSLIKPFKMALVPAFFALSGFLVTGSAFRLRRTTTFLAHRALRIFPALIVEVLLSACLLGGALTTLPAPQYFTHAQFYRYLLNAIGHVTFWLPGVFQGSQITSMVNGNLWTLPAELYCYLLMSALMVTGLAYRRVALSAAAAIFIVILALLHARYGISTPGTWPHASHVIVLYFVVGSLAFQWREKIKLDPVFFIISSVISYLALMDPATIYLAIIPVAYCVTYLGMIRLPVGRWLQSGDYSYGIYLYGFPLTQAAVTLVPSLGLHWMLLGLVAGLTTCGFAVTSWHLVEKHSLKMKRRLPERWFPTTPREREIVSPLPVTVST